MLLFRNPVGTGNRSDVIRKLADWARSILKAADDDGVSVLELGCCADGCCDPETLILVMREGRSTEAVTISKPLETITYADLEFAVSENTDCSSIARPS